MDAKKSRQAEACSPPSPSFFDAMLTSADAQGMASTSQCKGPPRELCKLMPCAAGASLHRPLHLHRPELRERRCHSLVLLHEILRRVVVGLGFEPMQVHLEAPLLVDAGDGRLHRGMQASEVTLEDIPVGPARQICDGLLIGLNKPVVVGQRFPD